MMDKDELTRKELVAWTELRALVDRLTPERLELPEANPDGWSVKDVLWHLAHWWDDLSRMLGEMREGTFVEPPDDDEADEADDAENRRVLEESRGMALADVEEGVRASRERLLSTWASLTEVGEPAERWFTWETIEHYQDHVDEVRRMTEVS